MRLVAVLSCPLLVLALPLLLRDIPGLLDSQPPASPPEPSPPPATTPFFVRTSSTSSATSTHLAHAPITIPALSPAPLPLPSVFSSAPSPATHDVPSPSAFQVPVSAPSSALPEPLPTSPEEATQWKVIGIGIITVGLIATVILSIIFFDSWWNFLCDLLCGKNRRRSKGQENMVPDWATRDWELKLANEDGHRYPTISSLTDIADNKSPFQPAPTPALLPPDFDPLFLHPPSRRPSTRYQ